MRQLLKLNKLKGLQLQALDGKFGKIDALYFDTKAWITRYIVIQETTWLGGRRTLMLPQHVKSIDLSSKSIDLSLSLLQAANGPRPNELRLASENSAMMKFEQDIYQYYRCEPYWKDNKKLKSNYTFKESSARIESPEESEHTLHSSDKLKRFRLHAVDGEFGHIEDLIVEEDSWKILYLEVDTQNWLPSKHVLLAPAWIEKIDWQKQLVFVLLDYQAIKTAPKYLQSEVIGRQYQLDLYLHYGKSLCKD